MERVWVISEDLSDTLDIVSRAVRRHQKAGRIGQRWESFTADETVLEESDRDSAVLPQIKRLRIVRRAYRRLVERSLCVFFFALSDVRNSPTQHVC